MKSDYILEISNGKKRIYPYRQYFAQNGFSFVKRSCGKSYYAKKCQSEEEKETYVNFCKKYGLSYCVLKQEYIRSNNYRKNFIDLQNFKGKYTICAYCGLPVKIEKITVDHIIPVDKAKKTNSAKILMKILGITDVNEPKNLCSACRHCNSKKHTKMGLWTLRGFAGKNKILWFIRWAFRIVLLCVLIAAQIYYLSNMG